MHTDAIWGMMAAHRPMARIVSATKSCDAERRYAYR